MHAKYSNWHSFGPKHGLIRVIPEKFDYGMVGVNAVQCQAVNIFLQDWHRALEFKVVSSEFLYPIYEDSSLDWNDTYSVCEKVIDSGDPIQHPVLGIDWNKFKPFRCIVDRIEPRATYDTLQWDLRTVLCPLSSGSLETIKSTLYEDLSAFATTKSLLELEDLDIKTLLYGALKDRFSLQGLQDLPPLSLE